MRTQNWVDKLRAFADSLEQATPHLYRILHSLKDIAFWALLVLWFIYDVLRSVSRLK
jgi:hypothetical protein